MKKVLAILLVGILCMSSLACKGPAAATTDTAAASAESTAVADATEAPEATAEVDPWADFEPLTITLATANGPTQTIEEKMNVSWMAAVTERSGGKITFDYFPGAQLGSYISLIEQVDSGAINMSVTDISMFESYAPEFAVLYFPYIMDSYEHAAKVIYGEGGEILKNALAAQTNIYLLGVVQHGARVTATVNPINKVEDCKNVIMRTPEAQVYVDWCNGIGMASTPMAMSEAYTAIQTGVAQGIELPIQALAANGYPEVAPNIWKDAHMYAFQGLHCNKAWWDALPDVAKDLMVSVWEEQQFDYNTYLLNQESDIYADLIQKGITVTECDYRDDLRSIYSGNYETNAATISPEATALLAAIEAAR